MKRIFLTGASSGIGLATARALLDQGEEVWGTSRNPAVLPKHENFHPVRLDLGSNRQIEEAFADSLSQAEHFDVVINNAGSGHFGPAELLTMKEIEEQFQVLFFGHVRLMQLALESMRSRGAGLIINVTSLAALLPVPFMGAYNAAKSALASFIMSMQIELGQSAVKIVDVQPGDIHTNFNEAVVRGGNAGYESRVAKAWIAVDRNLKTAPKPELVARKILQLMDQSHPPARIAVGDVFQTKIAPFIFRFLPQRTRIWGLKMYYGI